MWSWCGWVTLRLRAGFRAPSILPHGIFAQGVAKSRPRGFSLGGALGECLPDLQVDGRTETGKSAH